MFDYAAAGVADEAGATRPTTCASLLATAEVDGQPLDDIDFYLFFLLLVDAGGDTTRNLVGGGLLALFEHPDQLDAAAARPRRAAADARRGDAALGQPGGLHAPHARRATPSCDGTSIAEGDKVVMYYGAANRDPSGVRPTRTTSTSAHAEPRTSPSAAAARTSAWAPHIARIEIDAMLREVLTRLRRPRPGRRRAVAGVELHLAARRTSR